MGVLDRPWFGLPGLIKNYVVEDLGSNRWAFRVAPLGYDGTDFYRIPLSTNGTHVLVESLAGAGGGGTEYTEGTDDIGGGEGTIILGKDPAGIGRAPTVGTHGRLLVDIATNPGAGGGTEYTEGVDSVVGGEGTLMLGKGPGGFGRPPNIGTSGTVVVGGTETNGNIRAFRTSPDGDQIVHQHAVSYANQDAAANSQLMPVGEDDVTPFIQPGYGYGYNEATWDRLRQYVTGTSGVLAGRGPLVLGAGPDGKARTFGTSTLGVALVNLQLEDVPVQFGQQVLADSLPVALATEHFTNPFGANDSPTATPGAAGFTMQARLRLMTQQLEDGLVQGDLATETTLSEIDAVLDLINAKLVLGTVIGDIRVVSTSGANILEPTAEGKVNVDTVDLVTLMTTLTRITETVQAEGEQSEDAAHGDVKPMLMGGRFDDPSRLISTSGNIGAIALDPDGTVKVRDTSFKLGKLESTWNFEDTQSISPASGEWRRDNATPSSVTLLWVSDTDSKSDVVEGALNLPSVGDLISFRNARDHDQREVYRITGNSDEGTYHAFNAVFLFAGPTAMVDGASCEVVVLVKVTGKAILVNSAGTEVGVIGSPVYVGNPTSGDFQATVELAKVTPSYSRGNFNLASLSSSYQDFVTNAAEIFEATVWSQGDVDVLVSLDGGSTDHFQLPPGGFDKGEWRKQGLVGPGGNVAIKQGDVFGTNANMGHLYVRFMTE